MKQKKIIITITISIFCILLFIIIYQQNEIDNLRYDIEKFYSSYEEEIVKDDFSVQINDIDILKNNDFSGIIYFGRDTCNFCSEFNKILKYNFDFNQITLYKFDTDKWRDNPNFSEILNKYNVTTVPILVKILPNQEIIYFIPNENENENEITKKLSTFLSD